MIWFTLALFFVSFVLTALLAPKPQLEDARPQSLEDVNFPRATENAPIPLVLGKVRMQAPNTIWYGAFRTVPITERVKVSLFRHKNVIVGYRYYLGLDLALALGPGVQLHEIWIDDKLAWSGSTSSTVPTAGTITQPNLFGGYKNGGGFTGSFTFYPGSFSSTVDSYVEGQVGAGNVPAYNGISHIVFDGCCIGEAAQLKKMAFVISAYTDSIGINNNSIVNTDDINPAEAAYHVMTDDWRGLGIGSQYIDTTTLRAVGNVLYTEGNGSSIQVTSEADGNTVVQELLRQVDGFMYQDPETGLITPKLIRDDYTVSALPVYDETDITEISKFSKSAWSEVYAQVKVSFKSRTKDSQIVALAQDMSIVNTLGRLKSTSVSFPFVYDPTLANKLAARELSQMSVPLLQMTISFNRNAYKLRPGDVFKLSWADYRLTSVVMRVQQFDLAELVKGNIVVDCIQDKFAVSDTVFANPAPTTWTPPVTLPSDITSSKLVEMPRILANTIEYPTDDGYETIVAMAKSPSAPSSSYSVNTGATGNLDVADPAQTPFAGSGVLGTTINQEDGYDTGYYSGTVTINSVSGDFSQTNDWSNIAVAFSGVIIVDNEWIGFESATDNGDGTYDLTGLYRGLFGSQIEDHIANAEVWEVISTSLAEGSAAFAEGASTQYNFTDYVGANAQDAADVTESTKTFTTPVANRPIRPGYVTLDGLRTLTIKDGLTHTIDFMPRNRMATASAKENDAAQTPDLAEVYDVDVYVDGVKNTTLSTTGLAPGDPLSFAGTKIVSTNCQLRVTSRRTVGDLRSSASYAFMNFSLSQLGAGLVYSNQVWDNSNFSGTYTVSYAVTAKAGRNIVVLMGQWDVAPTLNDFCGYPVTLIGESFQNGYDYVGFYYCDLPSDQSTSSVNVTNPSGTCYRIRFVSYVETYLDVPNATFSYTTGETAANITTKQDGFVMGGVTGKNGDSTMTGLGITGLDHDAHAYLADTDFWQWNGSKQVIQDGTNTYTPDANGVNTARTLTGFLNLDPHFSALPITNPDAETGDVTGWTSTTGVLAVKSASPAAHGGTYYFTFSSGDAAGEAYQDITIADANVTIDDGNAMLRLGWFQAALSTFGDQGTIEIEFFDGSAVSLGTYTKEAQIVASTSWEYRSSLAVIPAGTRVIRLKLKGTRTDGSVLDAYFDDIFGRIIFESQYFKTTLLAGFNGTNGDTTTSDESANAIVMTGYGTPTISNAQSRFGGTSLASSSGGFSMPNTNFNFGSNDFTIQFSVYPTAFNSNNVIAACWQGSNRTFALYVSSGGNLSMFYNSTYPAGVVALDLNAWNDITIVRQGTTVRFWKNGVYIGSHSIATSISTPIANFTIGSSADGTDYLQGYIDEFRVMNGFALYTSTDDIPAPTAQFERA
jgi:hypothetical protein